MTTRGGIPVLWQRLRDAGFWFVVGLTILTLGAALLGLGIGHGAGRVLYLLVVGGPPALFFAGIPFPAQLRMFLPLCGVWLLIFAMLQRMEPAAEATFGFPDAIACVRQPQPLPSALQASVWFESVTTFAARAAPVEEIVFLVVVARAERFHVEHAGVLPDGAHAAARYAVDNGFGLPPEDTTSLLSESSNVRLARQAGGGLWLWYFGSDREFDTCDDVVVRIDALPPEPSGGLEGTGP